MDKRDKDQEIDRLLDQLWKAVDQQDHVTREAKLLTDIFRRETKPFMKNLNVENQWGILIKFIEFAVNYKTICMESYRPLSGNFDTYQTLLNMNKKLLNKS